MLQCSNFLILDLPTSHFPPVRSIFKIRMMKNLLLKLQNILFKSSHFQVALEAELFCDKSVVRRSGKIFDLCVASRAERLLNVTSLEKRYGRLQIIRAGWKDISPDNLKKYK
jgi:hypothetical protein